MSQNWIKEKKFCSTQQNSVWTELVVVFYIFGHFLPHQPPPPPNNKDLLFEGKWKWRNQKKKKTNTKFPKKNWFFLSLWMVIIIIIILHTDIVQLGIVDQYRTMNWMKRNEMKQTKNWMKRISNKFCEEKKKIQKEMLKAFFSNQMPRTSLDGSKDIVVDDDRCVFNRQKKNLLCWDFFLSG